MTSVTMEIIELVIKDDVKVWTWTVGDESIDINGPFCISPDNFRPGTKIIIFTEEL